MNNFINRNTSVFSIFKKSINNYISWSNFIRFFRTLTDIGNSLQGLIILVIFLLHKKKRKIVKNSLSKLYQKSPKVDPVVLRRFVTLEKSHQGGGSWNHLQTWQTMRNAGVKLWHRTTKPWRRIGPRRPRLNNIFTLNQWKPDDFSIGSNTKI